MTTWSWWCGEARVHGSWGEGAAPVTPTGASEGLCSAAPGWTRSGVRVGEVQSCTRDAPLIKEPHLSGCLR